MLHIFRVGLRSLARLGTGEPLARPVASLYLVLSRWRLRVLIAQGLSFSEAIRDTLSDVKHHPGALRCNR
jgi:hypothetical protein